MSNIPKVKIIANKLENLNDRVVYVGGAIIELLLDKEYALKPRMSEDVDTIIEIYTRGEYSRVEAELRSLGFKHVIPTSHEKTVICRFVIDDVTLDIMPTKTEILGFSNIWYEDAFKNAISYPLEKNLEIKLVTAPYLLATKFEAFLGRGENNFHLSHDLEDIISVIDGRKSIVDEVQHGPIVLQKYLSEQFSKIVDDLEFINALPGHLAPYGVGASTRADSVRSQIKNICALGK